MMSGEGIVRHFYGSIGFYILTYVVVPVLFLWVIYLLTSEGDYFRYVRSHDFDKKPKFKRMYRESKKRIKRYQVFMVILILVLLPTWHIFYTGVSHQRMHSETVAVGSQYVSRDPIFNSLGPTYDTDYVKERMMERPDIWLPELVNKTVDMDELTRLPGRMAIYRLTNNRMIITYTYVAPYPIMKAYGFTWIGQEDKQIVSQKEKTFVFPQNPSGSASVSEIV